MLEQVSVWLLSAGVVVVVAVCVQLGILTARHVAQGLRDEDKGGEGMGAVVGAMLGLLAFMLAFAFGMAADRRNARKDLLLDEVNSIGTTYLRAGMIPEPHRSDSRSLLRRYVDLRLDLAEHPDHLQTVLQESSDIHRQLWIHAEALADADLKNPDIAALYVDSLNETIDLQTSRVTVARYRIPPVVWLTFALLMILSSLAVGYNAGQSSTRPHILMTGLLSASFGLVMFLIFDLDHGNQGWLKVDQQPMYELRDQLAAPRG
jgi:hypothetical protein